MAVKACRGLGTDARGVQFREAFGKLREMLGSTKIADLRSLNFRLDFSEFYTAQASEQD